ncbi:Protein of unknown function [Pyronema omphalodes CBS 100304]|uniref:Uncharacterized protein n=1 Tax=Pyronema omphalodes (strain CBS 100304) TaxID=1076935 RepID=U4LTY4_PYROM|nr:Protein of unknown function [Pyronema omphalodes CBS 100304]
MVLSLFIFRKSSLYFSGISGVIGFPKGILSRGSAGYVEKMFMFVS